MAHGYSVGQRGPRISVLARELGVRPAAVAGLVVRLLSERGPATVLAEPQRLVEPMRLLGVDGQVYLDVTLTEDAADRVRSRLGGPRSRWVGP